ncbi:ABC transporter permease [Rathayibacter sp. AY1D2]|nr:ABC transporter permease [Rathayibacter sp. AY1C2]PPG18624.1 ABC transporter permease [Rathayibacter sp. AY1C6]PPG62515.1 ABC transporter permease [Rathayibacter sp. AY1C7]PPH50884.1 ABC transporter permease [Rathayibacter sp. AY1E1]PPH89999.1 ABC transporter permease [Rathayibacter sp. AY1D5]PPI09442.1 ABC transporter permease [Rathayibacter sp. AY1B8]PPI16694.1 ABC transporter permease [Rathayibacter sp. AY1D2]
MTATADRPLASAQEALGAPPPAPIRGRRRFRGLGLGVYTALALLFLLIPIGYTFVFSFNDSGKSNLAWRGFTLDKWVSAWTSEEVMTAFGNSLLVGVIATVLATALGTMIAIALVRFRFRFRSAISLLLFLPMATPEVVLGAGLAAQFLSVGAEKGLVTIVLAHTMFCISFVVVTVKARVASLDPKLEEAGRDLYASPNQVFWRITFPLLLPGILAAALLSFALSFDDFIITNFNSGSVTTFPKYIYIAAARGIPAEANVIASAVFVLAILVVVITQVSAAARAKRLTREQ